MVALDDPIGSILIGTWVNSLLFAYEATEIAKYFNRYYKRDSWGLKALVGTVLLLDLAELITTYCFVYIYAVSHWGEPEILLNQYWPSTTYLTLSAFTTVIVQLFLTWRYWVLTRRRLIVTVLALFSFTAMAGHLASAVTLALYPAYDDRGKAVTPTSVWLISTAVADTAIALALVIQLQKAKTSMKATRAMLNRLIARSVRTGAITAVMALVVMAAFLNNRESNISAGMAFFLGRLYAISMMFNLNGRRWSGQSGHANSSVATPNTGTGGPDTNIQAFSLNEISFLRTQQTVDDSGTTEEAYPSKGAPRYPPEAHEPFGDYPVEATSKT